MGLILFWQISPFKPANVRSLKDKIDAFQASFESLQEAEAEAGPSHLGEPAWEGGSCKLIKYPGQLFTLNVSSSLRLKVCNQKYL